MTEIQTIIVTSVISGIMLIVGLYLGYLFSRSNIRETIKLTEFKGAGANLRAAFAPAIVKFKITSDTHEITEMLWEELIPQGVAIERFRPFVKDEEAYQEAWEKYHQSHQREGVSSVYFLDYIIEDEKERFKLFDERVHNILQFTKKDS